MILPISLNMCIGCSKEVSSRRFFGVPTTYVLVGKLLDQISTVFEHKIVIVFLPISLNMCIDYPQHVIWLRNRKNDFQICILIWGSMSMCSYDIKASTSTKLKFLCTLAGNRNPGTRPMLLPLSQRAYSEADVIY